MSARRAAPCRVPQATCVVPQGPSHLVQPNSPRYRDRSLAPRIPHPNDQAQPNGWSAARQSVESDIADVRGVQRCAAATGECHIR